MKKKNKLQIGKFYLLYGGPPHPAFIFAQDTKHNTYYSLKFGTTLNQIIRNNIADYERDRILCCSIRIFLRFVKNAKNAIAFNKTIFNDKSLN